MFRLVLLSLTMAIKKSFPLFFLTIPSELIDHVTQPYPSAKQRRIGHVDLCERLFSSVTVDEENEAGQEEDCADGVACQANPSAWRALRLPTLKEPVGLMRRQTSEKWC